MKDLSKRTAILVRFGYDGAGFWGLQPQPGLPTAGGALEKRLQEAASARPKGLAFAARTDRGVHAEHNLATCWFGPSKGEADVVIDFAALASAAAGDRDDGLKNVVVVQVPPTVHARGISRGKHYRYRLRGGVVVDGAATDALQDPRRWRIAPALDVKRMQEAAAILRGSHDFSSFRAGGCSAASANKNLFRLDVSAVDDADQGNDVVVDLVGDAFVRKMVRNLIGLLVEVGSGWRAVSDVAAVLEANNRQAAGICAPPEGLTLVAVGSAWPADGRWLLPDVPVAAAAEVAEAVDDEG